MKCHVSRALDLLHINRAALLQNMATLQDQEDLSSEVNKCGECTQDTAGHTIIRIVRVGEDFKFVVPSFPVFESQAGSC